MAHAGINTDFISRAVAWKNLFLDGRGGFYEKLSLDGLPAALDSRRLHASARLLYLWSELAKALPDTSTFRDEAVKAFVFLKKHQVSDGSFIFKVSSTGAPIDTARDAYGHAFVLFALAHYYELSPSAELEKSIFDTDQLCQKIFFTSEYYRIRVDAEGAELLSGFEQNHHMHLFEAYLELFRVLRDSRFLERAQFLYELFCTRFHQQGAVVERFESIGEMPSAASYAEPGHSFEWARLLISYAEYVQDDSVLSLASTLLNWADRYGWDATYGGIYDRVSLEGEPIKDSKRIWPLTEAIRAFYAFSQKGMSGNADYYQRRLSETSEFLRQHYLTSNYLWREHLSRDLQIISKEIPVTTLYHLLCCLAEMSKET